MLARVEGIQRRRWLKNSLKRSGAWVMASEAAQYSTRYPCCSISVHSHRSSPAHTASPCQTDTGRKSYSVRETLDGRATASDRHRKEELRCQTDTGRKSYSVRQTQEGRATVSDRHRKEELLCQTDTGRVTMPESQR